MRYPKLRRLILYVLLAFLACIFLLPLWTNITTALKTSKDVIYTLPIEPPSFLTLGPLEKSFSVLKRPMLNSFIFTTTATIISCVIGSINGYILTKIKFRGSNTVFLLIILGAFIPYQVVLIPLVVTMTKLGLYDNIGGLILTHTAYGIPITTLLFRNFYGFIPDSIIRAAKTDGAGAWTIYRRVVLPLSVLPFVVTAILQFTFIWNNFLFGLVLARSPGTMPASVALANLKGYYVAKWNLQLAGALWYALPVLTIYLLLGKHIMRGYIAGAVRV